MSFTVIYQSEHCCLGLVGDPLVRDGHEVPLHRQGEALAVLAGLDDRGLGLAGDHAHRLAHALHALNNVILYHHKQADIARRNNTWVNIKKNKSIY